MSSLFSTDPFPSLHSPSSYDDSSPDLSVLRELEMEYGEPVNPLQGEFLGAEDDVYTSPLSEDTFTISPYEPIPTPDHPVKIETTSPVTHHIPLLPFQSVTAPRTAKKRRRFVTMSNLHTPEEEHDDNHSIDSEESLSSQSSPITTSKKNKRAKNNPQMGKRERNKVSASKYRKRRKMYLDTLEERTHELESKYVSATETMSAMESENKILKEQLNFLKQLLHGKGQDMTSLEKQLHDGFQSTSNPQQSGSIFMFVLFSCFLLFNPMSWFTSTTTNLTTPPITYQGLEPPTTQGHFSRTLKGVNMDMTMDHILLRDEDDDRDSAHLSFLSMDTEHEYVGSQVVAHEASEYVAERQQLEFVGSRATAAPTVEYQASPPAYPAASAPAQPVGSQAAAAPIPTMAAPTPKSLHTLHARRGDTVPKPMLTPPATTTASAPIMGSPHTIVTKMSYAPITGAPRDLQQYTKRIDMDDPVRVHRVAQPVEPTPTLTSLAALDSLPVGGAPAPSSLKSIIDLTNTSSHNTSQHNTSERELHKLAHDQVYVPLVRLMGETHAQQALQNLAQGVMQMHMENQTEARPSPVPA